MSADNYALVGKFAALNFSNGDRSVLRPWTENSFQIHAHGNVARLRQAVNQAVIFVRQKRGGNCGGRIISARAAHIKKVPRFSAVTNHHSRAGIHQRISLRTAASSAGSAATAAATSRGNSDLWRNYRVVCIFR